MKQLIIKVGLMEKELRTVFNNPKNAKPGVHTVYLRDWSELSELLSPKRLELISFVLKHGMKKSVSALAKELNRKQEAISRDAGILEKFSLIRKSREKQSVYLKPLYNSLKIELGN